MYNRISVKSYTQGMKLFTITLFGSTMEHV